MVIFVKEKLIFELQVLLYFNIFVNNLAFVFELHRCGGITDRSKVSSNYIVVFFTLFVILLKGSHFKQTVTGVRVLCPF